MSNEKAAVQLSKLQRINDSISTLKSSRDNLAILCLRVKGEPSNDNVEAELPSSISILLENLPAIIDRITSDINSHISDIESDLF